MSQRPNWRLYVAFAAVSIFASQSGSTTLTNVRVVADADFIQANPVVHAIGTAAGSWVDISIIRRE